MAVKKEKSKPKVVKKRKVTRKAARKVTRKPAAKKRVVKKARVKGKPRKPAPAIDLGLLVGKVTHYFPHVNAGVINVTGQISIGDEIYFKGHTTDFRQKIESMQVDRVPIQNAKKGDEIGILVKQRVRGGDKVYKI